MTILRDLFGPGTWGAGGNLAAAPILALFSGVVAWLLRHKIGRGLASWWGKHRRSHAVEHHREANAELVGLVEQLRADVAELRALVGSQRGEGQG